MSAGHQGTRHTIHNRTMHPDTLAALRLLGLALATHPDDVAELAAYGDMPTHLADAIEDWIEGTDEDDCEEEE